MDKATEGNKMTDCNVIFDGEKMDTTPSVASTSSYVTATNVIPSAVAATALNTKATTSEMATAAVVPFQRLTEFRDQGSSLYQSGISNITLNSNQYLFIDVTNNS